MTGSDNISNEGRIDAGENPVAKPPEPEVFGQGILELISGIFFSPVAAIRAIVRNPSLWQSLGVVMVVSLVSSAVSLGDAGMGIDAMDRYGMGTYFSLADLPYLVIISLVAGICGWFFLTAVLLLMSHLLGGSAGAVPLMAALGFSCLPGILFAPVSVIGQYAGWGWILLLTLALEIWMTALAVISVREANGFSTGRAVLTLISPVIVITFFILLLIITMGAMMWNMLNSNLFIS